MANGRDKFKYVVTTLAEHNIRLRCRDHEFDSTISRDDVLKWYTKLQDAIRPLMLNIEVPRVPATQATLATQGSDNKRRKVGDVQNDGASAFAL